MKLHQYILSAPYHPSSNGQAERFIQTFERAMRAGEKDGLPLCQHLSEFLFSYQNTPHTTIDTSPAELFLQQKLQTKFDLLKPDQRSLMISRQFMLKASSDQVWP